MKTILMNTAILVADGDSRLSSISLEQAKAELDSGFLSAIGHQSTADLLTTLLGVWVSMNRVTLGDEHFKVGQKAVILKLLKRPPEGAILTREQIEELGYEFKLLEVL